MATKTYEGQLEIDSERGVIYFHSNETGQSILRICSLPVPIPLPTKLSSPVLLDITHGHDVSWRGEPSGVNRYTEKSK